MRDLQSLIDELLSFTPGADLAITFEPLATPPVWGCDFINPHPLASLGEVEGVYCGDGDTAAEAVQACIDNVRAGKRGR